MHYEGFPTTQARVKSPLDSRLISGLVSIRRCFGGTGYTGGQKGGQKVAAFSLRRNRPSDEEVCPPSKPVDSMAKPEAQMNIYKAVVACPTRRDGWSAGSRRVIRQNFPLLLSPFTFTTRLPSPRTMLVKEDPKRLSQKVKSTSLSGFEPSKAWY